MSIFTAINMPKEFLNTSSWLKNKFFINFGYIEDGPGDDLKYSQSHLTSTTLSDNPSLKQYFRPISNQYTIGSCVANATADAFEAQMAHRLQVDPSQVQDLSRLFIYWNARNLDTPPCSDTDGGSKIRFAFDSMARYGVPYENTYPYDISKVNDRPTIIAYREAMQNRISKFYRIDGIGEDRVGQIKQALCSGCPVVFGTKVGNNFKVCNSDAVITDPGGWYLGGHALVIVGWSEEKQAFEIRNSWGEDWGCEGYCWMDKNYIMADITSDLWVPTI
jgi:C1A family cysteine protease